MVGVPRSKGCQTCLQRRTKCDETRPACRNCVKYGVVCPGYDRELKFVAGKHVVRPRGRRQPRGGASLPSAADARRSRPGTDAAIPGSQDAVPAEQPPQDGAVVGSPVLPIRERIQSVLGRARSMPYTPRHNTALFVGTLMDSLRHAQPKDESVAFGTWIYSVAGRVDNSSALDTAICTFTLHLLGKIHQDEQVIAQSRTLYGQSLWCLQRSLNHPQEWRTPETLGASMILCLFELFAGTSAPNSWMTHATGVGRLIQLRGPRAYEGDFERDFLLSFRPIIIMNALFLGQDCFLAERPWQAVIVHKPKVSSRTIGGSTFARDSLSIVDRYFQLLAKLPSILRHGYALREARQCGMPIDVTRAILLAQRAEEIHSDFLAWYPTMLAMNPVPIEVPSTDPSSIFPTVLQFTHPWFGSLHMGYWASMLILQETLNVCGYHINYTESNRILMLNILRSIETVSKGFMGAYRCGYSIRIAVEFADDTQKAWIAMWLHRLEKTYAATSMKSFPLGLEEEGHHTGP
ncbi:hypothetical protein JX265_007574 [Neoarthrinium moseri]|uniref:Zn(2)-C6 fungal-type domain-containing protein n=1 Tax=Neoarthrinium moseri TaxID=1658444 RepID=A0A9Q0ANF7_9PEZI|nr:hypothetical protein JX265_007574 [Neoarthrinium moseri]